MVDLSISRWKEILTALTAGGLCHGLFALGAGSMVIGMFFGMTLGQGTVPWPYAGLVNALLLLQFPLLHSLLLTGPGRRLVARLAPGPHGGTLATTTYSTIAAIQLFLLFVLWTPSGIVWGRAEGWSLYGIAAGYAGAWALLGKAILDSGWQLQTGALGWLALLLGRKPVYPDMPTRGLFRHTRQPIYVSFALTPWFTMVWTPDQLAVAIVFTAFCVFAPKFKERRFLAAYGERFRAYRRQVPYWLPRLTPAAVGRKAPDQTKLSHSRSTTDGSA
ncbi:MAG: isoprenylcysteine carboxylmethyltransferase family protein [Alphaproteobacteria bacterium]|nr:isoprenylcysteine carboxylmethyltransferase family protein [Alphaproteobacteria bacterium]